MPQCSQCGHRSNKEIDVIMVCKACQEKYANAHIVRKRLYAITEVLEELAGFMSKYPKSVEGKGMVIIPRKHVDKLLEMYEELR